ncbi:MAG: hypothetical protein R2705_18835 [Ilumatobacteraceae bacterium]
MIGFPTDRRCRRPPDQCPERLRKRRGVESRTGDGTRAGLLDRAERPVVDEPGDHADRGAQGATVYFQHGGYSVMVAVVGPAASLGAAEDLAQIALDRLGD